MNDSFFDFDKEIESLDKQITENLTQPTITERMEESQRRRLIPLGWAKEVKEYWYVYVFLFVSALFTGTLAVYMGLSPSLVTESDGKQYINFNTDFGHVVLAIVYLIAFISCTEIAFAIFKWKFHTREENNRTQQGTMLAGMIIAASSILLTGWAGGSVVASNIAFLTEFQEIPPAAQKWVVVAIPLLITLYTILFSAYALSSEAARADRITQELDRKQKQDHQTRLQSIQRIAERKLQLVEIKKYMQLVEEGKLDAGTARAAILAGKTLGQLEKDLQKDIDGDSRIGDQPAPRGLSYEENLRLQQLLAAQILQDAENYKEPVNGNGSKPADPTSRPRS